MVIVHCNYNQVLQRCCNVPEEELLTEEEKAAGAMCDKTIYGDRIVREYISQYRYITKIVKLIISIEVQLDIEFLNSYASWNIYLYLIKYIYY